MWNNTSIMQDEVLSHRLGLIPLRVDPRKLVFPRLSPSHLSNASERGLMDVAAPGSNKHLDNDTIIMDLRVRCDRRPDAQRGETDPRKLYYDSNVYSGMLEWVPVNQQKDTFKGEEPKPVASDILLTKLRPGQASSASYYQLAAVRADLARWSTCTVLQERARALITPSGLLSVRVVTYECLSASQLTPS